MTGSANTTAFSPLHNHPLPPFPAPWHILLEPSSSHLWSNSTPKEVVFRFICLFVSTSLKWILKEFQDVFCCSSFLLFVCFQSCFAMTHSTLPCRQWGVAVPHRLASEVSFETASGYRWLQFAPMTLIFELTMMLTNQTIIHEHSVIFLVSSSRHTHEMLSSVIVMSQTQLKNIGHSKSWLGFWLHWNKMEHPQKQL